MFGLFTTPMGIHMKSVAVQKEMALPCFGRKGELWAATFTTATHSPPK